MSRVVQELKVVEIFGNVYNTLMVFKPILLPMRFLLNGLTLELEAHNSCQALSAFFRNKTVLKLLENGDPNFSYFDKMVKIRSAMEGIHMMHMINSVTEFCRYEKSC